MKQQISESLIEISIIAARLLYRDRDAKDAGIELGSIEDLNNLAVQAEQLAAAATQLCNAASEVAEAMTIEADEKHERENPS